MPELPWMVINASVLPIWLCMMFAPSSALSHRLAALPAIPAAWAVLYSTLLLASSVTGGDGSMASMAFLAVMALTALLAMPALPTLLALPEMPAALSALPAMPALARQLQH